MKYIAGAVSALAVLLFGLGYLQKSRRNIVLLGAVSRTLYVIQYLLAGAFAGAALDVLGAISAVLAGRRDAPLIKKYTRIIVTVLGVAVLAAGITLAAVQRNPLELLPMVGVVLQAGALWLRDEKDIRRLSLIGVPFWLVYNAWHLQNGSLAIIGDIWCATSLIIAMIRYDRPRKIQENNRQEAPADTDERP